MPHFLRLSAGALWLLSFAAAPAYAGASAGATTMMSLDAPVAHSSVQAGKSFTIGGWALNLDAPIGTGVDMVHIYAFPTSGPPIFVGFPLVGNSRPDVAAVFGPQFLHSGFTTIGGSALPAGDYTIVAYARNAMTQQFDTAAGAAIHVTAATSIPFIAIDTPQPSQVVTSAFEVSGWVLDAGSTTGDTGVTSLAFYVFPNDGAGTGVYVGAGFLGYARPDVAAIFGSQFLYSGFHTTITGLGPGSYLLGVYALSKLTGGYTIARTVHVTVNATALMSIDTPLPERVVFASGFSVSGWAIDLTAPAGTGVDALHVYAYPDPGCGKPPIFLGTATMGVIRPDVEAIFGSRFAPSGYTLAVSPSAAGMLVGHFYDIVVHAHSTASGTFNNVALVRVLFGAGP